MITRRFAVPLFVALCAVIFLLDAHTGDSSRWAVYTCNVLAEASELNSHSDNIQNGKEGFVITGRETSAVWSWSSPQPPRQILRITGGTMPQIARLSA